MNAFEQAAAGEHISAPPSSADYLLDRSFRGIATVCAWLILIVVGLILWEIGAKAVPAIGEYGLGFLTGTTWDVNKQVFGILPEIWGTLYSSFLALIIGGAFGITMAIFLTQDFLPARLALVFRSIVELLAAINSFINGPGWSGPVQFAASMAKSIKFHTNIHAYSGAIRPLIPGASDHPFRGHSTTDSGTIRPPVAA